MIEFKEKNDRLKPLLQDKNGELLRMVQFSDSIIIASLDDSKSALNKIVKAGVVLMQNALETGFALKGAIAKGPLTFDSGSGIYFGRSIIDAYLLEEELKFYGVVFIIQLKNLFNSTKTFHQLEESVNKRFQYQNIKFILNQEEVLTTVYYITS